jgi:hypothetical protein
MDHEYASTMKGFVSRIRSCWSSLISIKFDNEHVQCFDNGPRGVDVNKQSLTPVHSKSVGIPDWVIDITNLFLHRLFLHRTKAQGISKCIYKSKSISSIEALEAMHVKWDRTESRD